MSLCDFAVSFPTVRGSIVSDYGVFASTLGLDPAAMLRAAGLGVRCLTQPDLRIRVRKVNRLLELSAATSGVPDFGLQLSRTRRLSSLGTLGALMRDEDSVRDAIRRSITSTHLNSTAVWMHLTEADGLAVIRLTLDSDGDAVIRQGTEMALGGLFRILQHLLGPRWRPREVYFMHEPASGAASHRKTFGCPVHFAAEFNAIVLDSCDLDQPIPLSDGNLRRYAGAALAAAQARPARITVHAVKQQIVTLMPGGRCSSSAVAGSLGVDRRTLHRHLRTEGSDFSTVHNEVRLALAQQYLRAHKLRVAEVADVLGFTSLSSFSRWFSRQNGLAPTQWRAG